MADIAPDLIRAVIGFRQWRLRGCSELWSLRTEERWERGLLVARCADETHHAPEHACTCGFYAWYAPPPRGASAATADLVAGAVALWGQVELHPQGMRAERAMVVALALPMSWGAKRRRILAAAAALEVPAVPARRLVRTALSHGELIPPKMRPPDTTPNKRSAPGPPAPARLAAVADGYPRRTAEPR
ncbi:MAG: hypothetical protein QOG35_2380 [Solirubrobacteraceae bacterium]|nr:hypothetical protein [Solirubrobacteraceae bacterium]